MTGNGRSRFGRTLGDRARSVAVILDEIEKLNLPNEPMKFVESYVEQLEITANVVRNCPPSDATTEPSSTPLKPTTEHLAGWKVFHLMTPEQHKTMQLVFADMSNSQIAQQLRTSETNVKGFVRRITLHIKSVMGQRGRRGTKLMIWNALRDPFMAIAEDEYRQLAGIAKNWASQHGLPASSPSATFRMKPPSHTTLPS